MIAKVLTGLEAKTGEGPSLGRRAADPHPEPNRPLGDHLPIEPIPGSVRYYKVSKPQGLVANATENSRSSAVGSPPILMMRGSEMRH